MNELTIGVKLVAVAQVGCDGCALRDLPEACMSAPCTPLDREDGRSIIWVEKSE